MDVDVVTLHRFMFTSTLLTLYLLTNPLVSLQKNTYQMMVEAAAEAGMIPQYMGCNMRRAAEMPMVKLSAPLRCIIISLRCTLGNVTFMQFIGISPISKGGYIVYRKKENEG